MAPPEARLSAGCCPDTFVTRETSVVAVLVALLPVGAGARGGWTLTVLEFREKAVDRVAARRVDQGAVAGDEGREQKRQQKHVHAQHYYWLY